jgi:hypothetical protein
MEIHGEPRFPCKPVVVWERNQRCSVQRSVQLKKKPREVNDELSELLRRCGGEIFRKREFGAGFAGLGVIAVNGNLETNLTAVGELLARLCQLGVDKSRAGLRFVKIHTR